MKLVAGNERLKNDQYNGKIRAAGVLGFMVFIINGDVCLLITLNNVSSQNSN